MMVAPIGGVAIADDKVPLGGGAGIAVNGDLCTLTTIGHDRAGDLVGFTSAHCGGPGAGVAGEGRDGTVGSVVAADDGFDYAVIKFDPAKVKPIPNVDGFAINGLGPDPGFKQGACKLSRATGHYCFGVGFPGQDPASVQGGGWWQPDDDGAPVTANDLLVGMVRDGSVASPPLLHPRPEIVLFSAILNDVNAKGGPGAGFSPILA
jgi:hypothetical protein